jgi:hypothetical protein
VLMCFAVCWFIGICLFIMFLVYFPLVYNYIKELTQEIDGELLLVALQNWLEQQAYELQDQLKEIVRLQANPEARDLADLGARACVEDPMSILAVLESQGGHTYVQARVQELDRKARQARETRKILSRYKR